jgi:hypothetical protein
LGRPVIARSLSRTKNSERARIGGYRTKLPNPLAPGPLRFVLGLHFFLPPPGERCGRCWSQLGGGHSGDAFWRDLGGNGPAAGALNRAYPWPASGCQLPVVRRGTTATASCAASSASASASAVVACSGTWHVALSAINPPPPPRPRPISPKRPRGGRGRAPRWHPKPIPGPARAPRGCLGGPGTRHKASADRPGSY